MPHVANESREAEILSPWAGVARVWHRVVRAWSGVFPERAQQPKMSTSKASQLRTAGHWPTLVSAFLYFDYSFMVWTLLGVLANRPTVQMQPLYAATAFGSFILAGAVYLRLGGVLPKRFSSSTWGLTVTLPSDV